MQRKALEVNQLTVNYDKIRVLWEVSFSALKGQLIGVIGPNGAGKSTFLKALLGLIKPLSGKVLFFGESIEKVRERVAYIPQKKEIDWEFPITVFDVVLMGRYGGLKGIKWYRSEDREKTGEVLHLLGLDHLKKRQIGRLSGGQRQRLFLARALMQDADFYLLDEPFAGVDIVTERTIIEILRKLSRDGKTLLIVHHDLHTARHYFDSLLLLNTSVIKYGAVSEVFRRENIMKAFGSKGTLFEEASKLSRDKLSGLV